ncbi:CvpA family protein [candidate division NPL-UPA2 bacterium]|nr:CvpA family protein [candidate division NPL-UPA2 bacterium]
MNGLDFAIVGILALFSYFFGFKKGLWGMAFFLLTYLVSFLVATLTYERGGEILATRLGLGDIWAQLLSFLPIFLTTSLAIRLLGLLLRHLGGWLNRLGGVVSSLLIGSVAIGIVAVFLYGNPSLASHPGVKDSVLLRRAADLISQNFRGESYPLARGNNVFVFPFIQNKDDEGGEE